MEERDLTKIEELKAIIQNLEDQNRTLQEQLRQYNDLAHSSAILPQIAETSPAGIPTVNMEGLNEEILQTMTEGIVVEDVVGNFVFVNPRAAAMLGYDPEALIGRHWTAIIPQDQQPLVQAADQRRLQGESGRYELELIHKNGQRIPVQVSGSPRFDPESHQFIGTLAVFSDISAQKKAEEKLKESKERFKALSEASFEAIFISEKGDCLGQNSTAERMFGYTSEEAIGRPGTAWIAPQDREKVSNHMLAGYEEPYEATALRKDGTTFPAEIRGKMAQYQGRKVRITALREITKRKRAENISQIQRELATALNATTGLERILSLCLKIAMQEANMDSGGIYLTDRVTGDLTLMVHQGLSPAFVEANTYLHFVTPKVRLITEGTPVYIVYNDLKLRADDPRRLEGLKIVGSLPIHHEGQIIAVMNVASHVLEDISSNSRDILESIVAQMGGAISRARSEELLKQRVNQLALINQISRNIAEVLDLQAVLDRTARLIQESFEYQHVGLFIIDPDDQSVGIRAMSGDFKEILPKFHKLKIGQGLVGWVGKHNETALANNVEKDERYINLFPEAIKTKAELSVPIQISGEVVGVIDVQSLRENTFDKSDILMIETLADQVAVAIHNARLHESLQQELADRQNIEDALRESEAKFRNIVESSPMGMHMYELQPDNRLVLIDYNPAADQILGMKNQQFMGKTIEEAFPALRETQVPERYRQAALAGKSWKTDQIVYRENGISGVFEIYAFQTSPGRVTALFLDVTERNQAEMALRESEQKYRRLIETANDAIFIAEAETGIIIDANQQAERLTGRSISEIIGMHQTELHPPDEAERYRKIFEEHTKSQGIVSGNLFIRHKEGYDVPVDISASRTEIEGGVVVQGIFRDITERTIAEEALRESEEKFRTLAEKSPNMIFINSRGKVVYVNEACEQLMGYSREEYLASDFDFRVLIAPESRELIRANLQKHMRGVEVPLYEYQLTAKDGKRLEAIITTRLIPFEGEMAILGIVTDITEQKRTEQSLRENQALLESIFRAAPAGIGLVANLNLLQVNDTILKMTGRSREELIGQNIRILYPSDQDFGYVGREKRRQIQESDASTVETRWQHKDGKIIDVLMSTTPIDPDHLEAGLTFTALDITERKLAEQQIQTQLERLAALRHIDSTITASQELNFTLNIILEQAINLLNVDSASVSLLDPYSQFLEFAAGRGPNTQSMRGKRRQLGKGLTGRVALERQAVIIPNLHTDHRFTAQEIDADTQPFLAYCGVPLIIKGQVKGILEIFNRDPIAPTPDWIDFLNSLGGQAAIAIDNAELFNNLQRSNLELKLAYNSTLEGWSRALELRDFETRGHTDRVTDLVLKLARAVGIPENELDHVYRGALLHDIGKMGIPDSILLKAGKLNTAEWEIMKQHPVYAYEMLLPIEFLRPALIIPYCHHEKWDGSGYPRGLAGEAIPLAARVFAVIDVWDALSSPRPYRGPWTRREILKYIRQESGKYFDPEIVPIFLKILENAPNP